MKNWIVIVLIQCCMVLPLTSRALTPEQELFNELGNSLKTGNVREIAKYFASSIDITLPSSEDQYSKSQAELVLKNFFNTHTPSGFNLEHQGASNNGKYMIGTLTTNHGNFKVYVFVKDIGGQKSISELKIETP